MHLYTQIYEFAASAGALEGYVYQKPSAETMDMRALSNWIDNLKQAYDLFKTDDRNVFQPACNLTLGRAILSLETALGNDHELVVILKTMVSDQIPVSPDDFQKTKWFQK